MTTSAGGALPEPLQDIVEAARANEVNETALLIIDDPRLRSVALVWRLVPRAIAAEYCGDIRSVADMWDQLQVDTRDVARLSGLSEIDAERSLARLIQLRLIYPDGTLSRAVQAVLAKSLKDALRTTHTGGRQ